MNNKKYKNVLISDYGKICFLGGTISKKNALTCHHIVPISNGGPTTIDNIALVARLEHDMINILTRERPLIAREINEYLLYFKQTRDMLERMRMHDYTISIITSLGFYVVEKPKSLVLKREDKKWSQQTVFENI